MEDELAIELCVRGYHVYNNIWEAAVGEELPCEHEPRNTKDRYSLVPRRLGTRLGQICLAVKMFTSYSTHDYLKTSPPEINCNYGYLKGIDAYT